MPLRRDDTANGLRALGSEVVFVFDGLILILGTILQTDRVVNSDSVIRGWWSLSILSNTESIFALFYLERILTMAAVKYSP